MPKGVKMKALILLACLFGAQSSFAVLKFDRQLFCCQKPTQTAGQCNFNSFTSTTGCPSGWTPVASSTNPHGQAIKNTDRVCGQADNSTGSCI